MNYEAQSATSRDPYAPFVGSVLFRVAAEPCALILHFSSGYDGNDHVLRMFTMANVCMSKDLLFIHHFEYHAYDPMILSAIYELMEEPVTKFAPLRNGRAAEMVLNDTPIYFWSDSYDDDGAPSPVNLFEVKDWVQGQPPQRWNIQ